MSRASTITRLKSGTLYTVTRKGAGSYDTNGIYQPAGSPTTFDITASIQPLNGRQLQELPEAYHAEEVKVVYTATELRTRTSTDAPDEIAIEGSGWYVIQVKKWEALGETHYEAMISRQVSP